MALDYTTIQAVVNQRYLPTLYDNIFTSNHYLLRRLKDKAKTYNERQINTALEYAKTTDVKFLSRFGVMPLTYPEIVTSAVWTPKMLTGSLTIPLEDELENMSQMAIQNLLAIRTKNLQKAIEASFATHMWDRGTSPGVLDDSTGFNTFEHLINNVTATVGGIAVVKDTTNAWWQSKVLDLSSGFNQDATVEADLIDPTSDVYLKKLLQRGIALAQYQTGEKPNVIVMPQYLWDLLEIILDPQKTGSKMNEKAGSMGFSALDYRGIPLVADDDMVAAQTGDTDGLMYFINDNYLYMFFNAKAKFTATEFVRPANQNVRSSLVNAYGNVVITNRGAQCVISGLRSPQSYVTG